MSKFAHFGLKAKFRPALKVLLLAFNFYVAYASFEGLNAEAPIYGPDYRFLVPFWIDWTNITVSCILCLLLIAYRTVEIAQNEQTLDGNMIKEPRIERRMLVPLWLVALLTITNPFLFLIRLYIV